MKVGIDHISFYVPKIALDINEFAQAKNLEVDKLKLGLGLHKMSLMDVHEDTATMCANALLELFNTAKIHPKDVGRIYLGTESSLDGAKPTATYAVQLVEEQLEEKFGKK
jgi:hydroxymethylglutaryl-CoA synthase